MKGSEGKEVKRGLTEKYKKQKGEGRGNKKMKRIGNFLIQWVNKERRDKGKEVGGEEVRGKNVKYLSPFFSSFPLVSIYVGGEYEGRKVNKGKGREIIPLPSPSSSHLVT